MDSITQAVLGAAIGQAGYRHRLGRRALLFGAVCGTLPDLDVVAGLAGEWASLLHHRGPSHSVLVLPLVAPLVGTLGYRLSGRRGAWRDWWQLAFWALITHPLLDVFTSYGTQLLSPLSDRRFALDGLSIIDPAYTLPLLLVVLAACRKSAGVFTRRAALVALLLTTLYGFVGYLQSQRVIHKATEVLAAEGFVPVRVRALPTFMNVIAFRVIARNVDGDVRVGYTTPAEEVPLNFLASPAANSDHVETLLATREGQIFAWFTDGFLRAEVRSRGEGQHVRLHDLRYGRLSAPLESLWGAEGTVGQNGKGTLSRWNERSGFDVREEWRRQWALIFRGELP
ncbi:MAG: metal-dependent hydrolase [Myxococcota bacterium]